MIWFGKSFIQFCKSFINLIKLVSTRTCSSARVRCVAAVCEQCAGGIKEAFSQLESGVRAACRGTGSAGTA